MSTNEKLKRKGATWWEENVISLYFFKIHVKEFRKPLLQSLALSRRSSNEQEFLFIKSTRYLDKKYRHWHATMADKECWDVSIGLHNYSFAYPRKKNTFASIVYFDKRHTISHEGRKSVTFFYDSLSSWPRI